MFSAIDAELFSAPAPPEGPVINGAVSSTSVTVTVSVWSEVLPVVSVALTTTTYVLFESVSVGFS